MARLTDLGRDVSRYAEQMVVVRQVEREFYAAPFGGGSTGPFSVAHKAFEQARAEAVWRAETCARHAARLLKVELPAPLTGAEVEDLQAQAYALTAFVELFDELAVSA